MTKTLVDTVVDILFESNKREQIQHHKTLFKHHYKQAMLHKEIGDTHLEKGDKKKSLTSYTKMRVHIKAFMKHLQKHDNLK